MKKVITLSLVLVFSFTAIFAQKYTITKHALIIAIGNYPTDSTGWAKISSANDVALVQSALEYQQFTDIKVIRDNQATKEGILAAMKAFGATLKSGDVAVIHISSHGQQIEDYNKDEIDGLDEAVVAYGAPANYQYFAKVGNPDYRGEKHLRDDEFGLAIKELRQKLGSNGDLLLLIDACHSSTGTRGTAKVRGGEPPIVSANFQAQNSENKKEVFLFEEDNAKQLSHYVVISGARAAELNYEVMENNVGYGSLSYAVSQALRNCNKDATYRGLFASITDIMYLKAPKQTPTIEGDIDRVLFGGNAVVQEPYLLISEIISDTVIKLNGGKIAGLYDSTKVAIYPAGTVAIEGKTPMAEGYITFSDNLFSEATFAASHALKGKNEAWVFVISKTFPDVKIKVAVGEFKDKALAAAAEKLLKENPIVILTKPGEAEIILKQPPSRGDAVSILYCSDSSTYLDNLALEEVNNKIKAYAQTKFIREMNIPSSTYNIVMEFLPVIKKADNTFDTLALTDFMVNGIPEFPKGTRCFIKVTNKGDKKCYFSIIDIQPDGVINGIVPNNKNALTPDDYVIQAHKSFITPFSVTMAPPYGKEVYKVFASATPINMSFTVTTRGTSPRGIESSVEKILGKTFNIDQMVGKRGTDVDDVNAGTFGTTDVPFIIKP